MGLGPQVYSRMQGFCIRNYYYDLGKSPPRPITVPRTLWAWVWVWGSDLKVEIFGFSTCGLGPEPASEAQSTLNDINPELQIMRNIIPEFPIIRNIP